MEKQSLKYYLKSSLITFITGFGLVVLVQIKELNGQVLNGAVLIGILTAGFRAGLKAFAQFLIPVIDKFARALVNWVFKLFNKKKK